MMDIATRGWSRFMRTLSDVMHDCRVRVDVEEYDLDNVSNEIETPKRAVWLNIQEPDKLMTILFTESLKSKNIVSMTVESSIFFDSVGLSRGEFISIQGVCLTIVLRQTSDGETNIDYDVMNLLSDLFAHNHEGLMT